MPVLDLYKERKYNVIKLGGIGFNVGGFALKFGARDFKIPAEYTVEESERLLELDVRREQVELEAVSTDAVTRQEQQRRFFAIVFDQLEIMFQHFQPEITADVLRKLLTEREALDILGFFEKYRFLEGDKGDAGKKKSLA